jgi:hypothetical protein
MRSFPHVKLSKTTGDKRRFPLADFSPDGGLEGASGTREAQKSSPGVILSSLKLRPVWPQHPRTNALELDRKIKTALDETRLLILGAQVLFGFLFQSVFQKGYETLSSFSQNLVCAALALMVLSIGCLIAPSMQHRIVEQGHSTLRLERATSALAAWSLLPLSASLGLGLYIVFARIFGAVVGTAVGAASTLLAGFFLLRPRMVDWRKRETPDVFRI